MTIEVDGRSIDTDREGYLLNASDWTPRVAEVIAEREQLVLTDEHWEVIRWVRTFYEEFGKSPSIRPLVNYLKQTMGPEKGNSIYLAMLFPGGVAKQATKLAGLPKPARCT
ncbi:MAG: TusE/DsrC/DsvC family sulfur relay protein [Gammaproteobacteria bacterium]|nr:MAG: TusE/DsrC/DsvC family sulfur relay protein [Gammaproteobacteria bacterium]